jgi:hypothetical protein
MLILKRTCLILLLLCGGALLVGFLRAAATTAQYRGAASPAPAPDIAGAVKDCERRLGFTGRTDAVTMTDIQLMALCMHPFLKEHNLLK